MGWPIFLKQSTLLVCGNSSSLPQEPLGLLQRKKSLPDVADLVGVAAQQSSQEMTREEISVLSSARRDNVRRQMEEIERYKSNPIMYILNPRVQVRHREQQQQQEQQRQCPLLAVAASCVAHLLTPPPPPPPGRTPAAGAADDADHDARCGEGGPISQFDDLEVD